MYDPVKERECRARLEAVGRLLVPDEWGARWREENLQGTPEEQIELLERWLEEDQRPELRKRAQASEHLGAVRKALAAELSRGLKARLREGFGSALAFLDAEAALWKRAEQEDRLPAWVERHRRNRADEEQKLNAKLQRLKGSPKVLRGRRLRRQRAQLLSHRRKMTEAELGEVRAQITLEGLVPFLKEEILRLRHRVMGLHEALNAAVLRLQAEREALRQELAELNVFEEKVGTSADLAEYFSGLQPDYSARLADWLDGVTADKGRAVERIVAEALEPFREVDAALEGHCLIEKDPKRFIERIGTAELLAAPYVNLAYDLGDAPLQAALLTGYEGEVDLTEAIPQGVQVTPSRSLGRNEVVLAQVRLGIPLESLAGVEEWRRAAESKAVDVPLYTVDPETLDPL